MRTRLPLVIGAVVLATALLAGSPTSAEDSDPALSVPPDVLAAAVSCPGGFTHPEHEPVLLVHGTGATPEQNWGWNYATVLPQLGFDTCTVALPGRALGDIQVSSEYVVAAIRSIAGATGRQVDVLGHSQGGIEPRWALRWWPDIQALVDDLVTLGAPHHGTLIADAAPPGFCSAACYQMQTWSRLVAALNSGDETPGAVSYTSIASHYDELVQPQPSTNALDGGTNVIIQDLCPGRPVDHVGLAADAAAFELVMDAFTHAGPADPARFDGRACQKAAFDGVYDAGWDRSSWDMSGFNPDRLSGEPPLAPYAAASAPPSSGPAYPVNFATTAVASAPEPVFYPLPPPKPLRR